MSAAPLFLRALVVGLAVAGTHALSCKMCIGVVNGVEQAQPASIVCPNVCKGLPASYTQCAFTCSYLLSNVTFIKDQVLGTCGCVQAARLMGPEGLGWVDGDPISTS